MVNKVKAFSRKSYAARGAIGKAIIVYFFSGSIVVAGIAYLIFHSMGC